MGTVRYNITVNIIRIISYRSYDITLWILVYIFGDRSGYGIGLWDINHIHWIMIYFLYVWFIITKWSLLYTRGRVKLYKTTNYIDLSIIRIYITFDIYEQFQWLRVALTFLFVIYSRFEISYFICQSSCKHF